MNFILQAVRNIHRIVSRETSMAEIPLDHGDQLPQILYAQEVQGVGADVLADALQVHFAGDQVFLVGHVGAEIAGGDELRCGDLHMDLLWFPFSYNLFK